MKGRLLELIDTPRFAGLLLLLAIALHIAFIFSDVFISDDYLHAAQLVPSAELQEKKLVPPSTGNTLLDAIKYQFLFFSQTDNQIQDLKQYGVLPWWTNDEANLHFFRPVSSLTHWLDYQLWPNSIRMQHAHSMLFWLLAVVVQIRFYRSVSPQSVAVVAGLILLLDPSIFFPITWIAARNSFILLLCLPVFWRCYEDYKVSGKPLSLALMVAVYIFSLGVAEGAIAFLAFPAAVAFLDDTDERKHLKTQWVALISLLLVTALWRWAYQEAGYGAKGLYHYLDPIGTLDLTLYHLMAQVPIMVFQVITGIDGVDLAFRGTYRVALAFVSVGLFYWVKQVARDLGVWNQPNRLLLYALVLSCIPFALLTVGDPRVLTTPHAIYALFLARMFYQYLQVNVTKIHVKVFLGLSLLGQIIIPIFIWAAASYMVPQGIGLKDKVKTVNYDALEEFPIQDKHVVIVNSPDPFVLMYYPYKAVYRGLPLPLSIRQLMLNIEPIELVRLSEYELEITQKGGMSFVPLDYESHLFPKLNQSTEDMHYLFQGFFHDGKAKFEDRQKFELPEMLIRLKHNVDNRPETISVKIDWDAMDNIVWLSWSWDSYQYEIFTLPAIGESIDFKGQFE